MPTIFNNTRNSEIYENDPGFGPDTEQRRVEFASKLEQETFDKVIEDALKMARINLITAMRVMGKSNAGVIVSKMDLRTIMIVWRIFEVILLSESFNSMSNVEKAKILKSVKSLNTFLHTLVNFDDSMLEKIYPNLEINTRSLLIIRNRLGGPLVLGLRSNTYKSLGNFYKKNQSRLSQSLRDELISIFNGLTIQLSEINEILLSCCRSSLNCLEKLIKLLINKVEDLDKTLNSEQLEYTTAIAGVFSTIAAKLFIVEPDKRTNENIDDRVRKYYGVS